MSSGLLSNLRLFAEYSAVAYCPDSWLSNASSISATCPSSVCPMLQNRSIEVAKSFVNVGEHHTTGVIMLDHSSTTVVISFRGTSDTDDWSTDLSVFPEPADDICDGCWVHSGFLGSWNGVKDLVLNTWSTLQTNLSHYKVVATGHSLGGALAQLAAAEIKKATSNATLSLFTYGSPRVGNGEFAEYMQDAIGTSNYRVTHLNDPVPRLPPAIGEYGYVHAGSEYHITSPHIPNALSANSTELAQPANRVIRLGDVMVISDPESDKGVLGYDCTNPAMHGEYLGPISGCGGDNLILKDLAEGLCGSLEICCAAGSSTKREKENEQS